MLKGNWEDLFETKILRRGILYAKEDSVNILSSSDTEVKAIVKGTCDYEVDIELNDGYPVHMSCNCPYADEGKNCKHMAAVLYLLDTNVEDFIDLSISEDDFKEVNIDDLSYLIDQMSKEDAKSLLLELANNDKSLENLLKQLFPQKINIPTIKMLKKMIDMIFEVYENQLKHRAEDDEYDDEFEEISIDDYDDDEYDDEYLDDEDLLDFDEIVNNDYYDFEKDATYDYNHDHHVCYVDIFNRYHAYGFNFEEEYDEEELYLHEDFSVDEDFLDKLAQFFDEVLIPLMIFNEFETIFLAVSYILKKLDKPEYDGRPINSIGARMCYLVLEDLALNCSRDDLYKYVQQYHKENDLYETENVLNAFKDFLSCLLMDEKMIKKEIKRVDKLHKEVKDYSSVVSINFDVGIRRPLAFERVRLMKMLNKPEIMIYDYLFSMLDYEYVLDELVNIAEKEKDDESLVSLLDIVRKKGFIDIYDPELATEQIVNCLSRLGRKEEELEERITLFRLQDYHTTTDYIDIKKLCDEEKWLKVRDKIVNYINDESELVNFYINEHMDDNLFNYILKKNDIELLDTYGLRFKGKHDEKIIKIYSKYLNNLIENISNQNDLKIIKKYLTKISHYNDGEKAAFDLVNKWIKKYPKKKELLSNLNRFS